MKKIPLQVILPLGAIIMAGAIGVSIGLLNLLVSDTFSPEAAVGFAGSLTVIIMVVAFLLSRNSPEPDDTSGDRGH